MRSHLRCSILAAVLALGLAAPVSADPAIVGDARDGRCREALFLADAAFRSTSGSLLWPIAAPSRRTTKFVLRRNARDISGGHAIDADPNAFAALQGAARDPNGTTFWAKHASRGRRLVVVDEPFNWRGDWYSVYLVRPDVTPERFASERKVAKSALKPLLGANRWNPPLVLEDMRVHQYWLIDPGEPYEVMPDWKVYVPARNGMVSPCRISFGYSPHEGVTGMLPAVSKLAAALDEALGPGTGEGTLQQTTAIRNEVAREWANASIRPWALSDAPYNSRQEVDRGIAAWARGNGPRTALLKHIDDAYPSAQRQLASYYAARLHLGAAAALRLSRNALDHMFRSYFVFPKTGGR